MQITIRPGSGTRAVLENVSADSKGLQQIFDTNLHQGQYTIVITCDPAMDDEVKVNFIAMWQKALKHMRFILGLPGDVPTPRSQIWRKYFRNKVDLEHNQGRNFQDFITHYLENYMASIVYTGTGFSITGRFHSAHAVAAAVGRIVNMIHWCEQWTPSIKLVSEAGITWNTFNKLTLECEQPIVRRRK
jgi:hypothetical protein